MKKLQIFKKLTALTASVCMLAFLPNTSALTVSAAGPVTYYVRCEKDDDGDENWEYQIGSEWDDQTAGKELYYMEQALKDGDLVVVEANGVSSLLTLNVHLSNLTIKKTPDAMAKVYVTGGIDNCYILKDTCGSVTGNVSNAYVYGSSLAYFYSNVTNLYSYALNDEEKPTINVIGTVAYYMADDPSNSEAPYGSNFDAGFFSLEDGQLKTDSTRYTADISGGPAAPGAQSSTPAAAKPAASGSSTASGEYDAVPKTGESSPAAWLSLIAVSCLSLSLLLRRSAK